MVHETTLDASMEEKANSRGHSSTRQAAQLALDAGVGRLIMTHVSSRYDEKGCQRLLAECKNNISRHGTGSRFRHFQRLTLYFSASVPITVERLAFTLRTG